MRNNQERMKHLFIRNFGPIKEVDLEFKKFNFFVGPQCSGKSTVAKVYSTCSWVEKEVATSLDENTISSGEEFKNRLEVFHKMSDYLSKESVIKFETDSISLAYEKGDFGILLKPGINYSRRKICYIPEERNVVAMPELRALEWGNTNLRSFLLDWSSAREYFNLANKSEILKLGINYYSSEDNGETKDWIEHVNGRTYRIPLSDSSSGLQSLVPLLLMLSYYSTEYFNVYDYKSSIDEDNRDRQMRQRLTDLLVLAPLYPGFREEERQKYVKEVYDRLNEYDPEAVAALHSYQKARKQLTVPAATDFILEEPEQNLFPYTQLQLIEDMVRLCYGERSHSITVTTHSPYIINFLNVLILRQYKQQNTLGVNPTDLNVFSIRDGYLLDQMQENQVCTIRQ